jgi:chemotaxis family two-component system response regulator Rcp1
MNGSEPPGLIDILFVEDSPADIELALQALREAGARSRLFVVSDGEAAMAFLQRKWPYERSPRPDLILLDLNLPGKDGREVLAEVKGSEDLKQIPVVILTGSPNDEDVGEAYALNANAYLKKPADLDELIETVKLIEAFWLSVASLPQAQ